MTLAISLLISLLSVVDAQAQQHSALTIEEAVTISLERNPAIAAARAAIEEADARVRQVKANYYP